jgi:hypothetical protein
MERLTHEETEQWCTDRGLPLWIMDEARMSTWWGYAGQKIEYDRGTGFYLVTDIKAEALRRSLRTYP